LPGLPRSRHPEAIPFLLFLLLRDLRDIARDEKTEKGA
jgi:hypothetical protein